VWTNREATGMKAIPRGLLILGGGPVGVEMAQVVCRLGGNVAVVEAAGHVLAREPAPLGEALGKALRRDGIELMLGMRATAARRDGEQFVLQFTGAIQPFPSFSGIYEAAVKSLRMQIADLLRPVGPTDAQMASSSG
jgi:pyruvate/2-oxoglutarate dehydrogenase complex dihydrolipoamide dehydrogenase (E3) component